MPLRIDIERAHIVPTTVYASYRDGLVILRVTGFNKGTASDLAEELRKARVALGASIRGVVLDLRGNPGGLLKQSVKVADLFLSEGQIVSTRGRHPNSLQYFEAGGSDLAQGLPIAVLVDGKSASAAEIVAAALQDQGRAVVIGTSSFGKGTVQTVIRLPNDGEITLTWSRLVTPSGYALHGLGVRPSVCTSGATGDAAAVIAQTLSERVKTAATLDAWRRVETHSMKERAAIRASCPAERRKNKFDLDLASALLVDRAQYARALDLVGGTAEAEN